MALQQARRSLPFLEARALLCRALAVSPAGLVAHPGRELTWEEQESLNEFIERRRRGVPLSYLTGRREFFGLEFFVNPAVLIPRPETEVLVEIALEKISLQGRVLDLGTGCGNVAISIALARSRAKVTAVDISEAALEIARRNWTRLTLSPAVPPRRGGRGWTQVLRTFVEMPAVPPRRGGRGWGGVRYIRSDWFSALERETFDVIVANPPYVAERDPHLEQGDVRFEPKLALLGGADGLASIRNIVAAAPRHLAKDGWLIFEHGYDQGEACRKLLEENRFAGVFSANDLAEIPRISGGQWRSSATV